MKLQNIPTPFVDIEQTPKQTAFNVSVVRQHTYTVLYLRDYRLALM